MAQWDYIKSGIHEGTMINKHWYFVMFYILIYHMGPSNEPHIIPDDASITYSEYAGSMNMNEGARERRDLFI